MRNKNNKHSRLLVICYAYLEKVETRLPRIIRVEIESP